MSVWKNTRSTVIPAMRYVDAYAAIDWLCTVFGFEKQLVVPGEDGAVLHAQLSYGNGMIMLGTVRDSEGGMPSGYAVICLIINDADADTVYARAVAAGAEIEMALQHQPFGGRAFSCKDLEGHSWNIGTYDPWADVESKSQGL